jgi:hypothetical protein
MGISNKIEKCFGNFRKKTIPVNQIGLEHQRQSSPAAA